jgi:hypothetical protein
MSTLPPGYASVGPIYIPEPDKQAFVDVCKAEGKTMEVKLKELLDMANGKKPWPVPVGVPNVAGQ